MIKKIFFFILFIGSSIAFGQETTNHDIPEVNDNGEIEVPFAVIEKVPIYPGCGNLKTNIELKACMSENIQQYVVKNFNIKLAEALNLPDGLQRIYVQFKINKKGRVVDVRARAPHPDLEKEAIRVVENFPKMKPGEQKGEPVGVLYALPITFTMEATKKTNKEK